MPRSKAAQAITAKLKIKRIKSEALCQGCHFSMQDVRGRTKAVSGISCESCHGAGEAWLKVHSEFSGKGSKSAELAGEAEARWKHAVALGMIRRDAIYDIAKNCYGCHVVPNEKLVNVGGHPAGSTFDLVAWSQGEVRHNVWYNKGHENLAASQSRRRVLFVIGLAVELEIALRAISVASKFDEYAIRMAHRADRARKALKQVQGRLPQVRELANITAAGYAAGLKLQNAAALTAAADTIATEARQLSAAYSGDTFAALDDLVAGPDAFVGTTEN